MTMTAEEARLAIEACQGLPDFFLQADYAAQVLIPDAAEALAESKDVEALARLLASTVEARKAIAWAEDEIKAFLADLIPFKETVVVEGVGTLERTLTGKKATWDYDRIVPAVALAAVIDPETGEIIESTVEAAQVAAKAIQEAAAFSYMRKTVLRAMGFDPRDYVQEEGGRKTVIFRPVTPEEEKA